LTAAGSAARRSPHGPRTPIRGLCSERRSRL